MHVLPSLLPSFPLSLFLSEKGIARGSCEGLTLQGWEEGVTHKGTLSPPRESRGPEHAGVFKDVAACKFHTVRTARSGSLALTQERHSPVLLTDACEHSTAFHPRAALLLGTTPMAAHSEGIQAHEGKA